MKIIAIDPGRTTGYTVGIIKEESELEFISKQAKLPHLELWLELDRQSPDIIVCESFEFRNAVKSGTELISAELLGVVHLYASLYKKRLDLQTASTHGAGGKKGYFTNSKLQKLGCYLPAKPHAMDSLRVLLHWYEFGKGFEFNNKLGYKESMFHHL